MSIVPSCLEFALVFARWTSCPCKVGFYSVNVLFPIMAFALEFIHSKSEDYPFWLRSGADDPGFPGGIRTCGRCCGVHKDRLKLQRKQVCGKRIEYDIAASDGMTSQACQAGSQVSGTPTYIFVFCKLPESQSISNVSPVAYVTYIAVSLVD